jgi:hypothetical protein
MKRELKHDILAEKIWERLPEQDKQLRQVKRSLEQRAMDYHAGKGSPLGLKELAAWEDYLPKIELDENVYNFIEESRQFREAEAAKKITEERRKRRWAIWAAVIGFVLAALAIWQSIDARAAQNIAEQNQIRADSLAQVAQDSAKAAQLERTRALGLQQDAETNLANFKKEQIQKLQSQASAFRKEERFADALQAYSEAMEQATDTLTKQQLAAQIATTLQEQNKYSFERNRDIGLAMQAAGYCSGALRYLQAALRSQPNNENLKNAIEKCQ